MNPVRSSFAPAAVWLLIAAGALVSCDGSAGADDAKPDSAREDLVVFVYDRSASITDFQLERARELTDQRIRELDFGDRIAALEVLQRSLSEPPRRWSQHVPEREFTEANVRRDSVSRIRFLRDAQDYLRSYTDSANRGGIMHTDILATLHDVASEIQAYPSFRPIVYVFSDMLQSDGAIEMEGGRAMPPDGWVEQRTGAGRLPDLDGACVMVIGARTDTQHGQRVKDFWDRYFEATGAELRSSNYTYRPVRLPTHPCDRGRSGPEPSPAGEAG